MVCIDLASLLTTEQASAWNSYSARVAEALSSKGKASCAVEFAGLGVIGRADDAQKKAALKLSKPFMQACKHPQLSVEADKAQVQDGAPTKVPPRDINYGFRATG